MNSRERVKAAMHYRPVDKVPVQYYYCPVGYYEHGEKLNDLYSTLPGDFEPFRRMPIRGPEPEDYDPDGSYHAYRRDEWGTLWEYRIFGITGIPKEYPIPTIDDINSYQCPKCPPLDEAGKQELRRLTREHQQQYYNFQPALNLIERLRQLMPDDELYCALAWEEPALDRLADRICTYNAEFVSRAIDAGADGLSFGDDYGSEKTMLISPESWRRFFKPRLRELFAPAVKAGLDIHFHSCGWIAPILEDLREIGVTSIWPQLPAYPMEELAAVCRSLGLAVAIHTDRANTMTYGTPQQVRDLILKEYEVFRMQEGGSWFYIEADNGFPFENIRAMVETIRGLREGH